MKEKYIVAHKKGGFQVMLWLDKKHHYIGLYPTIEEAKIERDKAIRKLGITNTSRTYESHYADNKEMMYEMIISKEMGILTPKLLKMCMKIVKGVSRKFRYKEPEDRWDCEAYCYEMIIKNWYHFDLDRYDNVFSWVTQVVKNGFALQFKRLMKSRINTISLDYTNEEGKKMINI